MLDCDEGLEVRPTPLRGRGIFATQDFRKGEFVVEYSGELIDIREAEEREAEYSIDLTKGCFMFYISWKKKQYCIDATPETGRLGRLINHSKLSPNLKPKVVTFGGKPRLILVASRDLQAEEELLYDYGDRSKLSIEEHPWLAR